MIRINVNSNIIHSIGYDTDQEILEIQFNDGEIYQYYSVSQDDYGRLMNSIYQGQFNLDQIQGKFSSKQINNQADAKIFVNNFRGCPVCGERKPRNISPDMCDDCYYSIIGDANKEAYDASSELWGYTDGNGDYFSYDD